MSRLTAEAADRARFPRTDRLTSTEDYRRARRIGLRRSGQRFTVIVARASGDRGRIGISASRKIGGAVVRNRLRRLVREYYRTRRDQFPHDKDVVVIPRPGVEWLHLCDLTEIGALIRQACSCEPRRSG